MIKKPALLSSLKHGLHVSAIAFIAMSTHAMAEPAPEYTFQPSEKWNVQTNAHKIANASVQSCSVAAEFNNGFIVKLDGSHKWVQSLQIDLRQPALEQGKSYEVNLTVPGQAKIATKGIADKNSVININLNGQKRLYQAMRDNAVLDVNIEENNFRFFMVNFLPASKQFERCMAGGDIRTAATNAPLSASASSDPYTNITANEAIALEEAEAQQIDLGTGAADSFEPVPRAIPYEQKPAKPIVSNARTVAENAVAPRPEQSRKRVTEGLAEQIENNPDLVAIDPPAKIETQEVAVEDIPVAAIPKPELAQNGQDAIRGKSLIIPAGIDNISLDDTADVTVVELEQAAVEPEIIREETIETAPVVHDPVEAAPVKTEAHVAAPDFSKPSNESLTADDLNRMQLERFQKPAMVAPKTMEPVVTAAAIQEMPAADIPESEEPFSKPLEKVVAPSTTDTDKAIDIVVQKPDEKIMAPVPEREVASVETHRYVTPEFPTTTNTQRIDADFTTTDPDIGRKISQLEKMIQDLERENTALEDELKVSLKDTEDERLTISSENWNLERATMRFNEAERQLKSVGQQLQRERTNCQLEKRDLEAMLFDPEITDEKQLARLATLERKLQAAEEKLRRYEGGTH